MRLLHWRSAAPAVALTAGLAVALPGSARGQVSEDDGRDKLLTLVGIPSATVAPHGSAYLSLSGADRRSATNDDPDGAMSLGIGLGNAEESLGVQLSATVTSMTESFGDSGYFAVKASRRLHASPRALTYLGLSVDRIAEWGDVDEDVRADLTLSTFTRVGDDNPLMVSLGVGTNRRDDETEAGLFGGVGIGLTPNFGASLAWTGETVTLGSSFRVEGLDNVYFSVALEDAFDQEDRQRVSFTASFVKFDLFGG
ncbi:hypothetical protein [Rhodosalinus sp.]|uniref:hypothetical protein n=1 Tax=Rhodosalinus sp. TaxID=2047741 RepID=UPI0035623721